MSDQQGVERGPNYDWKHEAKHYQEECEELRDLCGKLERSWEKDTHVLESRVKELEALVNEIYKAWTSGHQFHAAMQSVRKYLGEK